MTNLTQISLLKDSVRILEAYHKGETSRTKKSKAIILDLEHEQKFIQSIKTPLTKRRNVQ